MKIYKVYAKNCISSKPIREVDEEELRKGIWECIDSMARADYGVFADVDWEDEEAIDKANDFYFESLWKWWEEVGVIECGDYRLVKAESTSEVARPDSCSWTKC